MEAQLYEGWVKAGYFKGDASSGNPPYSIVLPPPNVTGNLHMGHALDHTLMDVLTRRKRMQGYEVLWLPGMDHAGIATQSVVEKQLAVDGKTKEDFGRELFIDKVWDWKHDSGGTIAAQMRRLGDGVDWSRDRFTMDDGLSRAVRTIFKRLFDAGLIYRAERLVNWSRLQSTPSPSARICQPIVPPDSRLQSHTLSMNSSRPKSSLVLPSTASCFSTTDWVAIPAWSMPGSHSTS